MHRAKAFFYVCAGILLLALSYHLGARRAGAQAGGQVSAVMPDGGIPGLTPDLVATTYGDVYHGTHGPFGEGPVWTLVGHIPSAAPVVCIRRDGSNLPDVYVVAYDAAGNYFRSSDYGATWALMGNVFGSAVLAQRESFGAVKARYRATPGAAQTQQDK